MTSDVYNKLIQPFDKDKVEWRIGRKSKDKTKAQMLAYIDARDVMERLDAVVGWDKWEDRYEYHGNTCVCYLTVNGVTKADGSGETAVEAEKGQLSKALVRAAVKFGVGRYLYNIDSPWVLVDQWGNVEEGEEWKLDKAIGKAFKEPEPKVPTQKFRDEVDSIVDVQTLRDMYAKTKDKTQKEYIMAHVKKVQGD